MDTTIVIGVGLNIKIGQETDLQQLVIWVVDPNVLLVLSLQVATSTRPQPSNLELSNSTICRGPMILNWTSPI